jgi:hypothetical protein
MTTMLQIPRTRGAVTGGLLVLLGAWGALIPFVGPYFHYAYTPDTAWTLTAGRLWLEVVPGAVTLAAGILLLASTARPMAMASAELAALAGAWFAVGTVLSPFWPATSSLNPGVPATAGVSHPLEQIGFFTGLGVVIVFLAALALGRLMVVAARDTKAASSASKTSTPAGKQPAGKTGFSRWLVGSRS